MAMNSGSVMIDGSGGATGSGLAKAMYDRLVASAPPAAGAAGAAGAQRIADLCNIIAQEVVSHIQVNAQVSTSVSTTVAAGIAVQVTPATGTGATAAPGAGTGSGLGTVA